LVPVPKCSSCTMEQPEGLSGSSPSAGSSWFLLLTMKSMYPLDEGQPGKGSEPLAKACCLPCWSYVVPLANSKSPAGWFLCCRSFVVPQRFVVPCGCITSSLASHPGSLLHLHARRGKYNSKAERAWPVGQSASQQRRPQEVRGVPTEWSCHL
jgi:hypothetical protein